MQASTIAWAAGWNAVLIECGTLPPAALREACRRPLPILGRPRRLQRAYADHRARRAGPTTAPDGAGGAVDAHADEEAEETEKRAAGGAVAPPTRTRPQYLECDGDLRVVVQLSLGEMSRL